VALNKPEEWMASIDFSDPVTTVVRVAEEFDRRAPELTALITDGETDPMFRPIHALPVEHRWNRVPGVTLLGDAEDLFPRSASAAGESARNLKLFFDDNAPQSVVDFFTNYQPVK
jgi:hypothetical protein